MAGKPVLAMINGEGASIIEQSGAGLACVSGDFVGLADAVLKMSRMTAEERDAMGQLGREYCIQEFDREALMNRFRTWKHEQSSQGPSPDSQ